MSHDWIVERNILIESPRVLKERGPLIGAPDEFRGHRNLILAFKRGVLMGLESELSRLPPWYRKDEAKRAYEWGWRVGREKLKRNLSTRQASRRDG